MAVFYASGSDGVTVVLLVTSYNVCVFSNRGHSATDDQLGDIVLLHSSYHVPITGQTGFVLVKVRATQNSAEARAVRPASTGMDDFMVRNLDGFGFGVL